MLRSLHYMYNIKTLLEYLKNMLYNIDALEHFQCKHSLLNIAYSKRLGHIKTAI